MTTNKLDLEIAELLEETESPTVGLFLAEECFTVWEDGIKVWGDDGSIRYYYHIVDFNNYWDGSPTKTKIEHVIYLSDENDDIQVEISQELANRIKQLRTLINDLPIVKNDFDAISEMDLLSFIEKYLK